MPIHHHYANSNNATQSIVLLYKALLPWPSSAHIIHTYIYNNIIIWYVYLSILAILKFYADLKIQSKWSNKFLNVSHDIMNGDGYISCEGIAFPAVFICSNSSIACWRGGIYTFCRMLLITAWSRRKEGGKEVKVVYHPWPRQLPFDTLRLPFLKQFAYTKMFRHCSRRIGRVLIDRWRPKICPTTNCFPDMVSFAKLLGYFDWSSE